MTLRSRGYLPHLENPGSIYFVTVRLVGSIPKTVLEGWMFQRRDIIENARRQNREMSKYEKQQLTNLTAEKFEKFLDQGTGECWLRDSRIADLVVKAFKHFDGTRYLLLAWCIMPNHVHVLFKQLNIHASHANYSLATIIQSWKSFTAHKANAVLRREGSFWQREYYDRLVRNNDELSHFVEYTIQNPVKAGLCKSWDDWPWTGQNINLIKEIVQTK